MGKTGILSSVSSVESGISGFEEENPPSDPPKSVFTGEDLSPTVTGIRSAWAVWAGGLVFLCGYVYVVLAGIFFLFP